LISFFAVWAIDIEKSGFKEPERCTTDYSGFIKMAQMLVIYQAIEDMKHERTDYLSTSMEEMRLKFMTFDGRTPVGWIHGLRTYGRKLADAKTANGDIVWSDDLKTISWKEFSCTMNNLRGFVTAMLQQAKSRLEKLFLLKPGDKG
jgi:hypothetical protein